MIVIDAPNYFRRMPEQIYCSSGFIVVCFDYRNLQSVLYFQSAAFRDIK